MVGRSVEKLPTLSWAMEKYFDFKIAHLYA